VRVLLQHQSHHQPPKRDPAGESSAVVLRYDGAREWSGGLGETSGPGSLAGAGVRGTDPVQTDTTAPRERPTSRWMTAPGAPQVGQAEATTPGPPVTRALAWPPYVGPMLVWVSPCTWRFGPYLLMPRGRPGWGQLMSFWVATTETETIRKDTLGEVVRECRRRLGCPYEIRR
jgi:hypothetical protein